MKSAEDFLADATEGLKVLFNDEVLLNFDVCVKAMEDYSKLLAVEEVDKWISPLNEIEFLKWLEKNNCHPEYYEEDGVEYSWLNETDGIFYTTSELYSIFLHFSAPKQDKQK